MCGICGQVAFNKTIESKEKTLPLDKMILTLSNRGPDDAGTWNDDKATLGHTRLSIIDTSVNGHQPMTSETFTIVFNGCIYNYLELKAELVELGYEFKSSSDTEVLLKSYMEWGEECLPKLEGMFAFAIWNRESEELFIARDRFGIKPLYFSINDKEFIFASNTQAILSTNRVSTELDFEAIHFQFTLHGSVPAPYTVIKAIRKLEPAHYIKIKANGKVEKRQYWQLKYDNYQYEDEATWIDEIKSYLFSAIEKRVKATDVGKGVLLSGGLDSSVIVGIMDKLGVKNIDTFSIGFQSDKKEEGDEFYYSDMIAEKFNTNHHKFIIENSTVLETIPKAVEMMAEPMFGQDAVAFYLLSEKVKQDASVVLSGQGADELFGGYSWYSKMHDASLCNDTSTRSGVQYSFEPYYFDRSHEELLSMLSPSSHIGNITSEYISNKLLETSGEGFLNRVFNLDLTTLIVDDPVKRVDNMTMAWGLEARVPFLDHKLVEMVMSAPLNLKANSEVKFILKEIAKDIIPSEIVYRKKVGFPLPALKFVKDDFLNFMKGILFSENALNRGLYNYDYINQLVENPEASSSFTKIQGSKLWHLAIFELWLQKNLDNI